MRRKIWTLEEKMSIVLAMLKGDTPVTEICHSHQVSANQVYRWRDQFLEGAKEALHDGRKKKECYIVVMIKSELKNPPFAIK